MPWFMEEHEHATMLVPDVRVYNKLVYMWWRAEGDLPAKELFLIHPEFKELIKCTPMFYIEGGVIQSEHLEHELQLVKKLSDRQSKKAKQKWKVIQGNFDGSTIPDKDK